MYQNDIIFLLIQIDEAHSSAWPIGLPDQPEPHKNISERLHKANDFKTKENPPFTIYVDTWSNDFAETYHAWPDVYYAFGPDLIIKYMSTYGTTNNTDALIDLDCVDLISQML